MSYSVKRRDLMAYAFFVLSIYWSISHMVCVEGLKMVKWRSKIRYSPYMFIHFPYHARTVRLGVPLTTLYLCMYGMSHGVVKVGNYACIGVRCACSPLYLSRLVCSNQLSMAQSEF